MVSGHVGDLGHAPYTDVGGVSYQGRDGDWRGRLLPLIAAHDVLKRAQELRFTVDVEQELIDVDALHTVEQRLMRVFKRRCLTRPVGLTVLELHKAVLAAANPFVDCVEALAQRPLEFSESPVDRCGCGKQLG